MVVLEDLSALKGPSVLYGAQVKDSRHHSDAELFEPRIATNQLIHGNFSFVMPAEPQ